jgi:hypothetical protein
MQFGRVWPYDDRSSEGKGLTMANYSVKAAFVLGRTATGVMMMSGGINTLATALKGDSLTGALELSIGLLALAGNLALPCKLASRSLATRSVGAENSTHHRCGYSGLGVNQAISGLRAAPSNALPPQGRNSALSSDPR